MTPTQSSLFVPRGAPTFAPHPGAAGDPARIERSHAGIDDYVLAMDAHAFLPNEEGSS